MKEDLQRIFDTIIRSTIEFAVPTYGPMINKEMSDEIECIQKRASKIIYGWDSHYDELVSIGKFETLKTRGERLILNFAKKIEKNSRFKEWFPEKNYEDLNLRSEKKFLEKHARTDRLKNSPLYYMRRTLNDN